MNLKLFLIGSLYIMWNSISGFSQNKDCSQYLHGIKTTWSDYYSAYKCENPAASDACCRAYADCMSDIIKQAEQNVKNNKNLSDDDNANFIKNNSRCQYMINTCTKSINSEDNTGSDNKSDCKKSIDKLIEAKKHSIEALQNDCAALQSTKENFEKVGGGSLQQSMKTLEQTINKQKETIKLLEEKIKQKSLECGIAVNTSSVDADCPSSKSSTGNDSPNNSNPISQDQIDQAVNKAMDDINNANDDRDNKLNEINNINPNDIDDGSKNANLLPDYKSEEGAKNEFGELNPDKYKPSDTTKNKDNFESPFDENSEEETLFEPKNIDEVPGSTPCKKFSYIDHLITLKMAKHESVDDLNIIHDSLFKQCTSYLEPKKPVAENKDTIAVEKEIPSECADLAKYRDNELYQLFDKTMKEYELDAMKKAEFVQRKKEILAIDFNNADKNFGVIVMSIGAACDATKSLLELFPAAKLFSIGEKATFYTVDIIKSYFYDGKSMQTIANDIVISEVASEINPALSALKTMNSYYSALKEIKQFSQEAKTQIEYIQEQIKVIDNTIQFYDNKMNSEKEMRDNITLIANAISEYCSGIKKK